MTKVKTDKEKPTPGKKSSSGKAPETVPLKKGNIKPVVPSSVKK
ncbi:MAG: hypothetical protein JWQ25_3299 [Daejeonella sp.]|nr:hypothetical protein [Daejeonella sp.]